MMVDSKADCAAEEHTAALTLQICRAMAYTVCQADSPLVCGHSLQAARERYNAS